MQSEVTKLATLVVLVATLFLSGCEKCNNPEAPGCDGGGDGGVQPGLPNPTPTNITWTSPDGQVTITITGMDPRQNGSAPIGAWAGIIFYYDAPGFDSITLCPDLPGSTHFPAGICKVLMGSRRSDAQLGGVVKANETIPSLPTKVYLGDELNQRGSPPERTFDVPTNWCLGSC